MQPNNTKKNIANLISFYFFYLKLIVSWSEIKVLALVNSHICVIRNGFKNDHFHDVIV